MIRVRFRFTHCRPSQLAWAAVEGATLAALFSLIFLIAEIFH